MSVRWSRSKIRPHCLFFSNLSLSSKQFSSLIFLLELNYCDASQVCGKATDMPERRHFSIHLSLSSPCPNLFRVELIISVVGCGLVGWIVSFSEACSAIYRLAWSRFEGYCGCLATFGAFGFSHRSLRHSIPHIFKS